MSGTSPKKKGPKKKSEKLEKEYSQANQGTPPREEWETESETKKPGHVDN